MLDRPGKYKIDLQAYQREESQLDPALVDWELSQICLSASFLQVLGPCHPKTGTVWEDLPHWNFAQYTLLGLSIVPLHLKSATWSYLVQCLCLYNYTSVWLCMYLFWDCEQQRTLYDMTHNLLTPMKKQIDAISWCQILLCEKLTRPASWSRYRAFEILLIWSVSLFMSHAPD